jgi:hypothetical protein
MKYTCRSSLSIHTRETVMHHSSKKNFFQFVNLQVSESMVPPSSSLSYILFSLSWAAHIPKNKERTSETKKINFISSS